MKSEIRHISYILYTIQYIVYLTEGKTVMFREPSSILGRIGNVTDQRQAERSRQIALMKIKREKKNMAHEDIGHLASSFTRGVTQMHMR